MANTQFPNGIEVKEVAYLLGGAQVTGGNLDKDRFDGGGRWKNTYLQNLIPLRHEQANGTDVVTRIQVAHRAVYAGTIGAVNVQVPVNPNGGDKTISVELKISSDGITYATVLSGPISFSDADNTAGTTKTVALATTTYAAGTLFRWEVTAAGTTGTQAQGLLCQCNLIENGG